MELMIKQWEASKVHGKLTSFFGFFGLSPFILNILRFFLMNEIGFLIHMSIQDPNSTIRCQ